MTRLTRTGDRNHSCLWASVCFVCRRTLHVPMTGAARGPECIVNVPMIRSPSTIPRKEVPTTSRSSGAKYGSSSPATIPPGDVVMVPLPPMIQQRPDRAGSAVDVGMSTTATVIDIREVRVAHAGAARGSSTRTPPGNRSRKSIRNRSSACGQRSFTVFGSQ